jgi:hypothetical protein
VANRTTVEWGRPLTSAKVRAVAEQSGANDQHVEVDLQRPELSSGVAQSAEHHVS